MARKRKGSGPGSWVRIGVVGLAAVSILATAAIDGGNGHDVTADGPSGCVVLRMTP